MQSRREGEEELLCESTPIPQSDTRIPLIHTHPLSLSFFPSPSLSWHKIHTGYTVELGSDNWQLAMFAFTLLTGRFPWQKADITDPSFNYFAEWQKRKTTRTPKEFKRFTPRLLKMFRRMLEIKPSKRYPCKEVYKYLKDRWLNDRSPRSSTVKQFFNSSGNSDNYNPVSYFIWFNRFIWWSCDLIGNLSNHSFLKPFVVNKMCDFFSRVTSITWTQDRWVVVSHEVFPVHNFYHHIQPWPPHVWQGNQKQKRIQMLYQVT